MNLSNDCKITLVTSYTAAGTTDNVDSSVVDMEGFDGVMFVAIVGTVTTNGTATCYLKVSDTNAVGTNPASGAVSALLNASNTFAIIDSFKPLNRYQSLRITRATANVVIGGVLAIQYKASKRPTTHDATTLGVAAVLSVSPAA